MEEAIEVELEEDLSDEMEEAIRNGNPQIDIEEAITGPGLRSRGSGKDRFIKLTFYGKYSKFNLMIPLNGDSVKMTVEDSDGEYRKFEIEFIYNGRFIDVDVNVPIDIDKIDKSAASGVDLMIDQLYDGLDEISLEDREEVGEVRRAYNKLTISQKRLVENLDKLEMVEEEISKLEYEKLKPAEEILEEAIDNDEFKNLPDVTSAKKRRKVMEKAKDIVHGEREVDRNIEVSVKREHPIWDNRFEITLSYGGEAIVFKRVRGSFGPTRVDKPREDDIKEAKESILMAIDEDKFMKLPDVTSARKRGEVEKLVERLVDNRDVNISIKKEHPIWENKFEITLYNRNEEIVLKGVRAAFEGE